jgi:hypothetical protein
LVHPGFRLIEPKSLQLGERGDMDDFTSSVQVSSVRCQERSLDAKIVWQQDRRHESLLG